MNEKQPVIMSDFCVRCVLFACAAAGFGFVPSHAFIVRKDSLSSAALTSLADTLLTLNLQPTLLSALGLAGVANVTHPQDKSKV